MCLTMYDLKIFNDVQKEKGITYELNDMIEIYGEHFSWMFFDMMKSLFNGQYSDDNLCNIDFYDDLNLENNEKKMILKALQKSDWHQNRAARLLGISKMAICRRIRKFNIEPPKGNGRYWKNVN